HSWRLLRRQSGLHQPKMCEPRELCQLPESWRRLFPFPWDSLLTRRLQNTGKSAEKWAFSPADSSSALIDMDQIVHRSLIRLCGSRREWYPHGIHREAVRIMRI